MNYLKPTLAILCVLLFSTLSFSQITIWEENAKLITLNNLLGQSVKTFNIVDSNTLENGLSITGVSTGIYIVTLTTEDNIKHIKKIILD